METVVASRLHHDIRDYLCDDIVASAEASGLRLTLDSLGQQRRGARRKRGPIT
jgi:hypothetical protein